jgi:hypothetical protein
MSVSKNKELEKEVAALIQRQMRSWAQVGLILDRVEREKYWARDAPSFSEWLKSFAPRIGMKEASLWRFLGASRYYQKLRKHLAGRNVPFPPLARLPGTIGAEHLEILAKLERVVPKRDFEELSQRILAGNVTRNELRRLWKIYRPILTGRTARGRGVTAPRLDLADPTHLTEQTLAKAIATLIAAGPEWTGIKNPQLYHPMSEVILPSAEGLKRRFSFDPKKGPRKVPFFDVLALICEGEDSAMMMIAVLFNSEIENGSAKVRFASYCDRLWLALVGNEKPPDVAQVPEFVGLLRVDADGIQVERQASETSVELGKMTGETAKMLLLRLLQK